MAQGQRMLAITPEGSETERICREGFGWAVPPSRPKELSERITDLVTKVYQLRYATPKDPMQTYAVENVVSDLLARMHSLVRKAA